MTSWGGIQTGAVFKAKALGKIHQWTHEALKGLGLKYHLWSLRELALEFELGQGFMLQTNSINSRDVHRPHYLYLYISIQITDRKWAWLLTEVFCLIPTGPKSNYIPICQGSFGLDYFLAGTSCQATPNFLAKKKVLQIILKLTPNYLSKIGFCTKW